MWCQNLEKCINANSYVLQFPYGQCMEWTQNRTCPKFDCSEHQTCRACQNDSRCGWCDDGSKTGKGECVDGSYAGPVVRNATTELYEVAEDVCPAENWHFVTCPKCQCNGHSFCDTNYKCISCGNNTTGENCQTCAEGYYGNPLNGGNCSLCQCGHKAVTCNPSTGACFCSTKGEIGFTCEQCDTGGKYFGDATGNGTCFYDLQENYIFTFTLTPPNDAYVTAINFQNEPAGSDDVELTLETDAPCVVRLAVISNITLQENDGEVTVAGPFYETTKVKYVFKGDRFVLGKDKVNTTIRIYVSNFTVPFQVKVRQNFYFILVYVFKAHRHARVIAVTQKLAYGFRAINYLSVGAGIRVQCSHAISFFCLKALHSKYRFFNLLQERIASKILANSNLF